MLIEAGKLDSPEGQVASLRGRVKIQTGRQSQAESFLGNQSEGEVKAGSMTGCSQQANEGAGPQGDGGLGYCRKAKQIIWQPGNTGYWLIKVVPQSQIIGVDCWWIIATHWKKPKWWELEGGGDHDT